MQMRTYVKSTYAHLCASMQVTWYKLNLSIPFDEPGRSAIFAIGQLPVRCDMSFL